MVELRPELAGDISVTIARLAECLVADSGRDAEVIPLRDSGSQTRAIARVARPGKARDRATTDSELVSESSSQECDELGKLPSLTHSEGARQRAIAEARARSEEARDGAQTSARSIEQLETLLAPLNPKQHMTRPEGVAEALASFSEDQIRYAVQRVANRGDVMSPIGWLVDRAKAADATYFPPTRAPRATPDDPSRTGHRSGPEGSALPLTPEPTVDEVLRTQAEAHVTALEADPTRRKELDQLDLAVRESRSTHPLAQRSFRNVPTRDEVGHLDRVDHLQRLLAAGEHPPGWAGEHLRQEPGG